MACGHCLITGKRQIAQETGDARSVLALRKQGLSKQLQPCKAHGLGGALLDPGLDVLQVCLIDA